MSTNSRLFYIHDPMCSWCYAFSRSWTALCRDLPVQIEVVYVVGGLAPDTTEPMSLAVRTTVQQAWQRIEQTVPGVHFNWDFWSSATPMRSTYPACRAVLAAKRQRADCDAEIIGAIQKAYYQKAMNPSLVETLSVCAHEIGLDVERFRTDLASTHVEAALQRDLQLARELGVHSYPSLRLEHGQSVVPITIDYLDHRFMLDAINACLLVQP